MGRVERTLGVEQVEVVAQALGVELIGEFYGLLVRGDSLIEKASVLLLFGVGNQSVFDVLERCKDGLLVQKRCLILNRGLSSYTGADAACVKDAPLNRRADGSHAAAGREEVAGADTGEAGGPGEKELGEEIRFDLADAGGFRGETALGTADVGPAQQEV